MVTLVLEHLWALKCGVVEEANDMYSEYFARQLLNFNLFLACSDVNFFFLRILCILSIYAVPHKNLASTFYQQIYMVTKNWIKALCQGRFKITGWCSVIVLMLLLFRLNYIAFENSIDWIICSSCYLNRLGTLLMRCCKMLRIGKLDVDFISDLRLIEFVLLGKHYANI